MKKLFKTQQRFNLNIFTYVFDMNKCEFRDKSFIEQGLTKQISQMIDKFYDNYQTEILDLFFRVQRDLSNNYVLTVYSATERECKPLSMKEFIPLRNGSYLIVSPHTNIILTAHEVDYPMDIQDVEGTNEKHGKQSSEKSFSNTTISIMNQNMFHQNSFTKIVAQTLNRWTEYHF